MLTAFVAGYELQCRLGLLLAPGHYNVLGFHATGTLGSFGAAAACAHLLGLDAEQVRHRAWHRGHAGGRAEIDVRHDVQAAACRQGSVSRRCSPRGWRSVASPAAADVLECPQGFARTHSPDFNPADALATPPGGFHIRNNLFKYHAACYMTHAPIEAARKLREQHGLTPDSIARIRLRLDETCDRVCNIPAPRTGLEAKFSLRLTTAMALAGVDTGGLGKLLGGDRGRSHADRAARQGGVRFPEWPAEYDGRSGAGADRWPACRGNRMIPVFPQPISRNRDGGSRKNSPRSPNRSWAALRRAT